jgi:hypothetical protein
VNPRHRAPKLFLHGSIIQTNIVERLTGFDRESFPLYPYQLIASANSTWHKFIPLFLIDFQFPFFFLGKLRFFLLFFIAFIFFSGIAHGRFSFF